MIPNGGNGYDRSIRDNIVTAMAGNRGSRI